ncbi:MAG: MFS transporter [Planctomycetaceae bacterium]|nr:MAG: MFS transporter [Planctomycetaceae bacterium]
MNDPHESSAGPWAAHPTGIRWVVLALACGTSFFLYLHRYTWNFVVPQLRSEYGWSFDETQAAYIWFNVTYGLGQIPSGILLDRIGTRLFLTTMILLWSLVIPWQAHSSRLVVGLARSTIGVTQAGCYPGLARATACWFPLCYRTLVQGLVATVCGRGGGALSPILMATVLMATLGLSWQAALFVLTGLGLVFGILFWTQFRDLPEHDPRVNAAELALIHEGTPPVVPQAGVANSSKPSLWAPLALALRLPSVWMIVLMQMFVAGVDSIYSSLLGVYFLSKGVTLGKAGLLASLPLFGGMIGGLCAAGLNDFLLRVLPSRRWARSLVGLVSNLLACGCMLIMIQQSTATGAALALGAVKLFADMSQPTGWGACTDIGGRKGSATVFSIMNTGGTIGGVLLPWLFGKILMNSQTVGMIDGVEQKDFVPLFTTAAGVYVVSGLVWLFINCTKTLDDVSSRGSSRSASAR